MFNIIITSFCCWYRAVLCRDRVCKIGRTHHAPSSTIFDVSTYVSYVRITENRCHAHVFAILLRRNWIPVVLANSCARSPIDRSIDRSIVVAAVCWSNPLNSPLFRASATKQTQCGRARAVPLLSLIVVAVKEKREAKEGKNQVASSREEEEEKRRREERRVGQARYKRREVNTGERFKVARRRKTQNILGVRDVLFSTN